MADSMELLAAAVKSNDAGRAREILQAHPDLKPRLNDPMPGGHFGATLLLCALPWKNREMMDLLLEAGADINARSHWWAGGFGVLDDDRGLAPFLIERGAVVDAHAASRLAMLDRLEQLISANPELVHARGGDGQTPLHFAANVAVAKYLLDHGAYVDARDVDHESTPAQYMVRERQEVARYLVSRGCRTDILMASALGDVELVRKHLDADPASIRMSVSDQYFPKQDPRAGGTIYIWTLGANKTPHQVAREFRHDDVFGLLMDRSPAELKLSQACELGDEATFNALLASKPDLVSTLSEDDRQRLVRAAQSNNAEAVRLMLAAGWPVDAGGQHGGTALHWAAFHGNAGMTREILCHNPPLEVLDKDFNMPPLNWALYGSEHGWHRQTGNYAATVEALLDAGANAPELTEGLEASEPVRDVLRRRSGRK